MELLRTTATMYEVQLLLLLVLPKQDSSKYFCQVRAGDVPRRTRTP